MDPQAANAAELNHDERAALGARLDAIVEQLIALERELQGQQARTYASAAAYPLVTSMTAGPWADRRHARQRSSYGATYTLSVVAVPPLPGSHAPQLIWWF